MYIFDFSGDNMSREEALDVARLDVLNGCETTQQDKPSHSDYIDTIRGVGVWYCYGADHYFFTDETEED